MNATTIAVLERAAERARGAGPLADPPQVLGEPVPWNYEERARVLARRARAIIDLTTGDGELLGRTLDAEAPQDRIPAVAADRRARHTPQARELLGRRAWPVRASARDVPFRPEAFDLVLLRHRPFDPRQIASLVSPGGAALIEQVHARNWQELRTYLPRAAAPEDDLERCKKVFRRAGFELLDVRAHDRPLAFRGLAHLVGTLVAAPWIVPDFSVEADAEALLALETDLHDERGIVITRSRYVIEIHRPPPLG